MTQYIFYLIMQANEEIQFSIKVSMLEIYNEKIQDLLDGNNNNYISRIDAFCVS